MKLRALCGKLLFTVSFPQQESCLFHIPAVSADHYIEVARFANKLQIIIIELQQFRCDAETDFVGLSGFKENLLETFQLLHRTGDTAHQVTDVELNHLCTVATAGIGDGNGCRQFSVGTHLCAAQVDIAVSKRCVGQSVTERVERLVAHIEVIAAELLEPTSFLQRAAGILMIVEQWDLPHILRESSGQLPTGIDITEKDIADGISGFTPSEPYVQDGRHVFLLPSKHQRAAGEEYEHGYLCAVRVRTS